MADRSTRCRARATFPPIFSPPFAGSVAVHAHPAIARSADDDNARREQPPRSLCRPPPGQPVSARTTIFFLRQACDAITTASVTRSELIDLVAARCRVARSTAEAAVRALFDSLSETLARGDGIEIRGLGSFQLREYPGYRGRNPKTGAAVDVAPKRVPHFKAGKPLRARIAENGRGADGKSRFRA